MRSIPSLGLALAASLLLACSVERPREANGRAAQPIIHGTPDTMNLATVWVDAPDTFCSGTIIGKNGSTGYVLTAAHCTADLVIETNDWDDCALPNNTCIEHKVTGTVTHPSWIKKASSLEYQVLTIDNVDASTPVVPIAKDPDGLALGTTVELSGFGYTNGTNGTLEKLHERYHTTTSIHSLTPEGLPEGVSMLFLQSFDGPEGGGCNGDSGGPVYLGAGAERRVVGVITSGNTGCDQYGKAARVSAAAEFIEAVMSGAPIPAAEETCDTCRINAKAGACGTVSAACGNTFDCDDAETCWTLCDTDDCRTGCLQDLPGSQQFSEEMACLCGECAALCGSCALVGGGGTGGAGGSGGAAAGGGGSGGSGGEESSAKGGCGCRVEGAAEGGEGGYGIALAVAMMAWRRRRRG